MSSPHHSWSETNCLQSNSPLRLGLSLFEAAQNCANRRNSQHVDITASEAEAMMAELDEYYITHPEEADFTNTLLGGPSSGLDLCHDDNYLTNALSVANSGWDDSHTHHPGFASTSAQHEPSSAPETPEKSSEMSNSNQNNPKRRAPRDGIDKRYRAQFDNILKDMKDWLVETGRVGAGTRLSKMDILRKVYELARKNKPSDSHNRAKEDDRYQTLCVRCASEMQ